MFFLISTCLITLSTPSADHAGLARTSGALIVLDMDAEVFMDELQLRHYNYTEGNTLLQIDAGSERYFWEFAGEPPEPVATGHWTAVSLNFGKTVRAGRISMAALSIGKRALPIDDVL